MDSEFQQKVKGLPVKQQVALWVILGEKKFRKTKNTMFKVGEFGDAMIKYLISREPKELGRILGGILSSLLRNGMVEPMSGGRNIVWRVVPELHKHAKEYRNLMFPVVTYWEEDRK